VIYLAVIASVGALGVQMFAQRFTTSAKASLIYIAEPLFAAGFAWILAGQGMSNWELIGAGAILVSMIVGRIPGKK
jgi:drug/metabolite transporter (DMT)-like permease